MAVSGAIQQAKRSETSMDGYVVFRAGGGALTYHSLTKDTLDEFSGIPSHWAMWDDPADAMHVANYIARAFQIELLVMHIEAFAAFVVD